MEKAISQEERIRRAEELYYRRRVATTSGIRVSSNSVNSGKTKISLFSKMAMQLAICSVIYIIFYLIKNTNYIFSEDVISKTKELLSYDINFQNAYSQASMLFEQNKDKFNFIGIKQNESKTQNETTQNNEIKENKTQENKKQENKTQEGGIGGAEVKENESDKKDVNVKKSQMELDAEYIKKKYSFKIPLKGSITSRYGQREETEIVSANHYGIDIAEETGTAIYAAMAGTVTLTSSEGEYRKTYRDHK